jgi:hypothetical protein
MCEHVLGEMNINGELSAEVCVILELSIVNN